VAAINHDGVNGVMYITSGDGVFGGELLGFTGLGFMAYRRKAKQALMAA
jgi:putative IMPACT (imprinted ancient) family translation regulator